MVASTRDTACGNDQRRRAAALVAADLRSRTFAARMPFICTNFVACVVVGHEVGINGFANLTSLLMAYFEARFGVLGIYLNGRSKEKQACATGLLQQSVIDQVLKALVKKK